MRNRAILGVVVVLSAAALAGVVAGDGVDVVEAEAKAAFDAEYRNGAGDLFAGVAAMEKVRREGRKRLSRPGVIDIVVHGTTLPASGAVLVVRRSRPGSIEMVPASRPTTLPVVDK